MKVNNPADVAGGKSAPLDLDVRGHKCPIPILRLRRCLEGQAAGTYIRITATDPMTQIDIPHFCQQADHMLIEQTVIGENLYFLIKKTGD
ncbi:sulfurtransferase TusA family protein [Paremcibacter congregatus]|uniref:sulfurtransferase TusA family protein n=1 Tax=Paremcibacter congregatus TaxID=2043170 RepID=UPI0030EB47DE|tara:strand:- start:576 stop:845 length:270 start_codon:yes stop_codon:yes gene_type:complete